MNMQIQNDRQVMPQSIPLAKPMLHDLLLHIALSSCNNARLLQGFSSQIFNCTLILRRTQQDIFARLTRVPSLGTALKCTFGLNISPVISSASSQDRFAFLCPFTYHQLHNSCCSLNPVLVTIMFLLLLLLFSILYVHVLSQKQLISG